MDGNHLPRRIVVVEVQPQDTTPFTPHVGKKAEQMGMGLYQRSHFLSGVVCLWIVRYWQLIHRFFFGDRPDTRTYVSFNYLFSRLDVGINPGFLCYTDLESV